MHFTSRSSGTHWFSIWMLVVGLVFPQSKLIAEENRAVNIGSRLELFIDDFLIESRSGLTLQLHHPVRAEKVLEPEEPWEGKNLGHVSILKDGDRYRMYYRGHHDPGFSWSENIYTCYAESTDGVRWNKPHLGLVEWEGSKANNILMRGQRGAYLTPFIDDRPRVPASQRYKSFAGNPPRAMVAPDGLRWSPLNDEPVLPKPRFGIALWNPQREEFMAYVRAWRPRSDGTRMRNIALSTSPDFLKWSEPKLLDFGDAPDFHLYWNTALPYFRAPHLYLGFPMRLREYNDASTGERRDWTDAILMVTRDGFHFHQHVEAFVRPGLDQNNWQPHVNMLAYGIVPTSDQELSMYLTNAAGGQRHLRRLKLRTDGFVSLRASDKGGELITRPIIFSGGELILNFSTSAIGSVRVELQTTAGEAIPGFALDQCEELVGDTVSRSVQWRGEKQLHQLSGAPIRLRFVLKDADLYSFQFVSDGVKDK
ncbi:MAG: hypothetical protein H8E66_30780 [Planctomycetes bacterium]|nr:hypothetical protein [Planctomycetota bacterium]